MRFKLDYDEFSDVLIIFNTKYWIFKRNFNLNPNISLIFDNENQIVFIEILNASRLFKIDKLTLSKIDSLNLKITITNEVIIFNCEIIILTTYMVISKFLDVVICNFCALNQQTFEIAIYNLN